MDAADELYSEFSEFETQSSVRSGFGYTENVLLGENLTVDSPFAYVGLEGVVSRSFGGEQYFWNSLAYGDFRSYEKLDGVPDHSIVLLQTELEGYVGMVAKGRVGARYLSLTQVFDATFDELERVDFVVKADEPEIFFGYETIVGEYSYDLELGFGKMSFEDLSSDYESLSLEFEVERELTDALVWRSEFRAMSRSYTERLARSLSGVQIADTLLRTELLGFETGLAYAVSLGGVEHEFEVSTAYFDRTDTSSGYYDRSRLKTEFDWEFSLQGVEIELASGYDSFDYANQVGDDGLRRKSDSWYWELELERDLTDSWSVFASFSGEEDKSNEAFATYETRTALLGIRWR